MLSVCVSIHLATYSYAIYIERIFWVWIMYVINKTCLMKQDNLALRRPTSVQRYKTHNDWFVLYALRLALWNKFTMRFTLKKSFPYCIIWMYVHVVMSLYSIILYIYICIHYLYLQTLAFILHHCKYNIMLTFTALMHAYVTVLIQECSVWWMPFFD